MLNPRTDPLHARSDRLQVGEFVVDIPRREVVSPARDGVSRLTVKALHVLLALAWQPGKVVSREALLEWVWPDTMPTDDVLTQAIGQLRKAFHDSRESPLYLETIAKGGYRLLAPVRWLEPEPEPEAAAANADADAAPAEPVQEASATAALVRAARPAARPPWRAIAAMLAVAIVAIGAWRLLRPATAVPDAPAPRAAAPVRLDFRLITSRPGVEDDASLSPDGSTVAYMQADGMDHAAIMLQAAMHVPPRRLTSPPPGYSDALPAWSHDGRQIAFVRYDPDGHCQIMAVASSGGDEHKLADCPDGNASAYDWTPADDGLLMGTMVKAQGQSGSRLRRFDVASGQWRTLDYDIADGDIDCDPKYSPDGKWIVFRRNLSLSDLWRMPAAGGKPQRLTDVKGDIRGWDWLPDGSGLLFSLIGRGTGVFRYDIAGARLDFIAMNEAVIDVDIARQSPSMVFTVDRITAGIYRFDLASAPGGKVARSRVFASSGSELLPSLSPDGRTLAFLSDRSGSMELWLGRTDAPDSVRAVEGFAPVPRHEPVWSADGSRLLAIGNEQGRQGLYEVDAESGRARRLPAPAATPMYAAYTDDSDRLLVGSDSGEGRLQVTLFDTSARPWRKLAALQDVALVRFDARSGAVYFTRLTKPGTWRTDASLGRVEPADMERPHRTDEYKRWTIGADGPWFLDESEGCGVGWVRMGAPATASGVCLQRDAGAWPTAPSVNAAGTAVYATLTVSSNADIGLADISPLLAVRR